MVRPPCCETLSVNKRGVWTPEEDAKMIAFVSNHGPGNWTWVPKKAGLKRCGKSCRLRWTNYLRPDLKHDSFAPHEEDLILKLHAAIGSRWSMIAQQLPGRTDNDVKNYWNTKLKKKLASMGIDPVTHKHFSKLLADYGNIGGMQKPSIRIGSHSEDLKNTVLFKSDPFPKLPTSTSTSSPKLEPPTESSFFSNRDVMEKEAIPAAILGEGFLSSLSCSSTSSLCSNNNAAQEGLSLPFCWNDFLLEDVFLPPPAADNNLDNENPTTYENKNEVTSQQLPSSEVQYSSSSSSDISFVEAMLDPENEMFLNFPHLMEEPSTSNY